MPPDRPGRRNVAMLEYILFPVGLVLLIKGADWLVSGASSLALKLNISQMVIGLTIVSFGTSAPELVVNVLASAKNNPGIAYGNIVGSNICNVLLILGVSALISPLSVQKNTIYKEIPFSALAALVLIFLVNDIFLDGATASRISLIDALVLLSFFSIFMYYVVSIARPEDTATVEEESARLSTGRALLFLVIGLTGLVLGGHLIVNSAVALARFFGITEKVIGLTVVAIGTSLPELATSAMAAWRRNNDIAIGNVVGSNIFNIFFILGVSGMIKPLPVQTPDFLNQSFLLGSAFLLFLFLIIHKNHQLNRWHGAAFLSAYTFYTTALVLDPF